MSSKPPVSYRVGPVDVLNAAFNAEVDVRDPPDDGKLIGKFILLLSSWRWEVSEARQVSVWRASFMYGDFYLSIITPVSLTMRRHAMPFYLLQQPFYRQRFLQVYRFTGAVNL